MSVSNNILTVAISIPEIPSKLKRDLNKLAQPPRWVSLIYIDQELNVACGRKYRWLSVHALLWDCWRTLETTQTPTEKSHRVSDRMILLANFSVT